MYRILLMACGNPDHKENPYDNVVNGMEIPKLWRACESIKECQEVAMKYIGVHDLGSGNWSGGYVFDEYDNQEGYISYNGKYWEKGSKYYIEG